MSFLVWALVALVATFFGLRLLSRPLQAPPGALTPADDSVVTRSLDLTRLLGPDADLTAAPPPAADARFKLVGVAAARGAGASGPGGAGWAAIAVDGKPSRTYRVGDLVDGDLVVHGVTSRGVVLGPKDGPATITLELPQMPTAATGDLVTPRLEGSVVGLPVGGGSGAPPMHAPSPPPAYPGGNPGGMISNGGMPNLSMPNAPGAVPPAAMTPMVPVLPGADMPPAPPVPLDQ